MSDSFNSVRMVSSSGELVKVVCLRDEEHSDAGKLGDVLLFVLNVQ